MIKEFKTKDLYLASFLFAKEKVLARVDREKNICWFVFKDINEEMINKFWSGQAECEAKTFSDAIRTLKDRIFSEKQNGD